MPDPETGKLRGNRNIKRLNKIPNTNSDEMLKQQVEFGLEAANSVNDRTISCFSRGSQPPFAGINTFLKVPYCEDVSQVSNYEVAFLGAPHDIGTTYRPGARFGPQAVRRISALYDGYSIDVNGGVSLSEELELCDLGDIFTIPSNLEKSFDQVTKAVSHVFGSGVFPVLCGGDHSLSFPFIRGIAPHIEGNLGIIHMDRHLDIQERDMDERMHDTPFHHVTHKGAAHGHPDGAHNATVGLPNCHPKNLVQLGIGGWYGLPGGALVADQRGTSVMTVTDVNEMGTAKAAEMALSLAWDGCDAVYLSFDIDCIDAGFVPGTGSPEPGGLLPREALDILRRVAREGVCAMDVVEISPPYDNSDITAQVGTRAIMDVLSSMVATGRLGHRSQELVDDVDLG